MKIVEVHPSRRFEHAWEVYEVTGVERIFTVQANAIEYAKGRFGGGVGEIHVYAETGEPIVEKIFIPGRSNYIQGATLKK